MLTEASVNKTETPISRTTDFANSLRNEILMGKRSPSERLHLDTLRQEFNVSLSPIREGLSRLVAEGLLVPTGQRGYQVAEVSIKECVDIKTQRMNLEIRALRQSIERGDEDWEIRLMAAFQRLQNYEQKHLESSLWQPEEILEWENRHHIFHETLIDACGSPILMQFCRTLHQMGDRYRRVFLTSHKPDRNVGEEHEAMYQAAKERKADHVAKILQTHIERTSMNVLAVMKRGDLP